MDRDEIIEQVKSLAPWHLLVDVRDGVDTSVAAHTHSDGRRVSLVDGKKTFTSLMNRIYPEGLSGKTFFDNACNCGGYSFWAKELGAERTFGYDVRDHWINQAKFLRDHRDADTSGMEFAVADLYDIPKMNLPQFDITWFSGIFYHLPDPITGLKIAADQTREIFYLNTAIMTLDEEERGSGCLHLSFEGTEHLMTGVHNLNWFPSGPTVLRNMLNWLGFPEVRTIMWRKRVHKTARPEHLRTNVGRIAMVAARKPGLLSKLKDVEAVDVVNHKWVPRKLADPLE